MATDSPTVPVNGYGTSHGYAPVDPQQHQQVNAQAGYGQAAATSSAPPTGPSAQQPEIPKDEVGWYFVEQYYTTLSRNPEKLYLFYNKRSQFVSGQETDKVAVCVGQRAINDRIKELDFQDCKVRVTNVDSQASDINIVIQVIGEISNKSQPHKKFTQTFVLATQTNGYFVLNDIFRYIIEEEDEAEQETPAADEQPEAVQDAPTEYQEPTPTVHEVEPKTLTSSVDPAVVERDAKVVDQELEQKTSNEQQIDDGSSVAATNGDGGEDLGKAEAAAPPTLATEASSDLAQSDAAEDLKPETPKDPEPSPSASPPRQAPPQPAAPPKPAVPKTWASLAASANRGVVPVAPSTASTSSQSRPTPPPAKTATPSAQPAQIPPTAPATQREPSPASKAQDEWNTVTAGHGRQQSRQVNGQQPDAPQYRGYIKNVTDAIDGNELQKAIEQYGELLYFDIARQKNCAFVDFKTKDGYEAAVAASPIQLGGNQLYVEERRFKPGATPYVPRGQYQGNRGRGGFQNRGGSGGGGGGNYAARGARGSAPRGRGAAPT
ncbi:hypothetical protein K431DRAFT_286827 [Polychaeton citri CBS 116435]|uniref:NTF2-domain-containing protein n=1 Tax=Polychaeton citri CBS 116435 TaxID=1314669 RepID=A0A9P4Q2J2_9PEZI|nr:hypothetical protein K431DRAFT_286827 [Polychaeton citri CBS 116435]